MKKKLYLFNEFLNAFLYRKNPVYLIQFVTERCNARCPHCFIDFKKEKKELSIDKIEKLASASGNCLRNVALTGGEPFLRKDLFEIADIWFLNSTAKTISITTNGSMPERIEEFCQKISKRDIHVFFLFSYDFIAEKHSEYRRLKDLHLNVLESHKIIRKYSPKIQSIFQLTVNENNYECAINTYNYIKNNLGIDNINCSLVRGSSIDNAPIEVRDKVINAYKDFQTAIYNDIENKILKGYDNDNLTSAILNAKNRMLWKYVIKDFKEHKYISPCRAGELLGVIYSNGDIFPCEMLNKCFGNLEQFDYNYMKCWNSIEAKNIRKFIKESKCHCTYECAWLVNILSTCRYYPELLYHIVNKIGK